MQSVQDVIAVVLLIIATRLTCAASPHLRHAGAIAVGTHSAGGPQTEEARSLTGCNHGVRYKHATYVPSEFETAWAEAVDAGDQGCEWMKKSRPAVAEWLSTVQKRDNLIYSMASSFQRVVPPREEAALRGLTSKVFSKYVLSNICPGELTNITMELYVEPIVGHLRHPNALGPCVEAENSVVHVMDLSYQMINPWPAADFHLAYPGKKYLLDCGTASFSTSLQYLTTRYRQAGIEFDEMWAWEAVATDPKAYWESVPMVYQQRLHFYNTPITSDFSDPNHPLSIIRAIYRPGDFIAFKLDIDTATLENAIVAEIEADADLIGAIGEMFYEMHYDHIEMEPYFGMGNMHKLQDVTAVFGRLRAKGLLLHYWP